MLSDVILRYKREGQKCRSNIETGMYYTYFLTRQVQYKNEGQID